MTSYKLRRGDVLVISRDEDLGRRRSSQQNMLQRLTVGLGVKVYSLVSDPDTGIVPGEFCAGDQNAESGERIG